MATVVMDKRDELIMKLVHYFITEENYTPIVVNGVKDEIWLENCDGPYRIIRINSNNIFNKEQLHYDNFKIKSIVKQIKKKTLSFRVNTLNILLDVNEDLNIIQEEKNIKDAVILNSNSKITDKYILEAFPNINDKILNKSQGVDLIINITKDINEKTQRDNKRYEKTFSQKRIIITPIIIGICILVFLAALLMDGVNALNGVSNITGAILGANYLPLVKSGQVWRLVSCIFMHWSLIHLIVNMYSLYIIGNQIETFLGKFKYLVIFLMSGLCGSLLTLVILKDSTISAGASGAIFGLLGSLLYFGYHYRSYLGNVIRSQVIPIITLNLFIGFIPSFHIDNACHIGGLIGGFLTTMALGVDERTKKSEKINSTICLIIYIVFMIYAIFFK